MYEINDVIVMTKIELQQKYVARELFDFEVKYTNKKIEESTHASKEYWIREYRKEIERMLNETALLTHYYIRKNLDEIEEDLFKKRV